MSRTFRKKKQKNMFHWSDSTQPEDYFREDIMRSTISPIKIKKRLDKLIHSEMKCKNGWGAGIPHDFVNTFCERPFRMKSKQAIIRGLKNEEFDVVLPKFIKDAGWWWY